MVETVEELPPADQAGPRLRPWMRWWKQRRQAWAQRFLSRRTTRRLSEEEMYRSARQIVGPTGNLFSGGWKAFESGREAYMRSFDPRVPASVHVSARDRTRANIPVPLAERCIDDISLSGSPAPTPAPGADGAGDTEPPAQRP